jgi:hypothetical protein
MKRRFTRQAPLLKESIHISYFQTLSGLRTFFGFRTKDNRLVRYHEMIHNKKPYGLIIPYCEKKYKQNGTHIKNFFIF